MEQIISVVQTILNGVKSPVKAGVGAVLALFIYFFVLVQKGELRVKKADEDKDEQKGESNIDLENSNAQGEDTVRDRLNRKPKVNDT